MNNEEFKIKADPCYTSAFSSKKGDDFTLKQEYHIVSTYFRFRIIRNVLKKMIRETKGEDKLEIGVFNHAQEVQPTLLVIKNLKTNKAYFICGLIKEAVENERTLFKKAVK